MAFLLGILFMGCTITNPTTEVVVLPADSLVVNIEKYSNVTVAVEGVIVHLCGVDGKKMKLMTESGAVIKIVPIDTLASFDEAFYDKRVRVLGVVRESRIETSSIDRMEQQRAILCHIDNAPCKDSAWVKKKQESGAADTLSQHCIDKLRTIMKQTGKNYIPVITIIAEKVELVVPEKR